MHPTSQRCHPPLWLPGKHCMPPSAPQHDLNIRAPHFPCISLHALTSNINSLPQVVYVCVRKCFACTADGISCCSLPCSCETGRKASIIFDYYNLHSNFLATKCQGEPCCGCTWENTQGKGEGGSRERRPWGHGLKICYQHRAGPCQRQVTLSNRDTQARAGLLQSDCLLQAQMSHFLLNFKIAKNESAKNNMRSQLIYDSNS